MQAVSLNRFDAIEASQRNRLLSNRNALVAAHEKLWRQ